MSIRPAFSAPNVAFLDQHCLDCHDDLTTDGGLDLTALKSDLTNPDTLAKWVLVHDRIRAGEMPPENKPQPAAAERDQFLADLSRQVLEAELEIEAQRGKGLVRRMNRTEYEHTLQDLLALPLLRVKELLPEDGQQHGFDKVPSALELSHVQIRKYLEAADLALQQAVVDSPRKPETQVWRGLASEQGTGRSAIAIHAAAPVRDGKLAPELTSKVMGNPVNNPGNTYRAAIFDGNADSMIVLSGKFGAHQPQGLQPDRFRVQTGGWYRVRFSIWGCRWNQGAVEPAVRSVIRKFTEYHGWQKPESWKPDEKQRWVGEPLQERGVRETEENTAFYGDAEVIHVVRASLKGKVLGFFDAPSMQPTEHEFRVWLEPGEKVSFHTMTLPGTGPMNSAASNGVRSYEGPGVAFDWFEIEGPLLETWPPQSQQLLFGERPIGQIPRPMIEGKPTIDEALTLSHEQFEGSGHKLESEWLLNLPEEISTTVNFPKPGTYEFRVTAFQTPGGDEPAELWTKLNGREMPHGRFKIEALRDEPQTIRRTFEIESAGSAEIGVQFPNDFFDEKTKADRNLGITGVEIVPVKTDDEDMSYPEPSQLLNAFATRAFRRPVEPGEIEPYRAIVDQQLRAGEAFGDAMLSGYKAILCAPDFLFLGLEGDTALASRLSYFLWNSLPDDELMRLAAAGELKKSKTLRTQVLRMLDDSRSDRFVEHFLDEWLELKDIDFTTPDPQLYPEFDPWLRDSMLAETRAYFRDLITENRSIDHVVDSDFVLINQRLAELYEIRGVAGGLLREVKLPSNSPRGGFLAQAAVLKVTANGTATSPVLRGVWVTERILGIPLRPPPPNIPAVEPDATGAVTIRELIEAHRADEACASCHRIMDPPGFALESFDVIGGWRDNYRASGRPKMVWVGEGKERVKQLEPHVSVLTARGDRKPIRLGGHVDASGQLLDGGEFEDIDEFRQLLLADKKALARNLARQLTIYATGKGYRFSDRPVIEQIVDNAENSDFGVRSLIEAVVTSALFTEQTVQP
ncbi:MAG: DUF1592 domain-containing protein [Verrucomicrobiota bacterium]